MFRAGEIVYLYSKATGKTIRLSPPGNAPPYPVDGLGAEGKFAQWKIVPHATHVSFESVAAPGRFLRIQVDGQLNVGGQNGGPLTFFNVSTVGGGIICLSSAKGHGNIGILPTGQAKNGKQTGTGPHGQFTIKRPAPPDPFPELKNGKAIHLRTCSGKNLKAIDGVVDGLGLEGKFAKWVVHRVGQNQVRLQAQSTGQYLRIQNNQLNATGGTGPLSLFVIHRHANGTYSFEADAAKGSHVGIMPNGAVKLPNQTGKGLHGTFTVC